MRATNRPSARRPVLCTRGTSLRSVTVSDGAGGDACAAAPAAAPDSRTQSGRTDLRRTLEPVIEPDRETQSFAGGHRLGEIHTESAPIHAEPQLGDPAPERRQPVARQP